MAYLAEKLKSIPDGDGTLLDHSLILYGTNMGNSNQHQHYDVPHILVGGANGKLKGNRHLAYDAQDGADRQPAAERAGHVRHRAGQAGRQHRSPAEAGLVRTIMSVARCGAASSLLAVHRPRRRRRGPERRRRRRAERRPRGGAEADSAEGRRQRAAGGRRHGAALGGLSRRSRARRRADSRRRQRQGRQSRGHDAAGDGGALRQPGDDRPAAQGRRRRQGSWARTARRW